MANQRFWMPRATILTPLVLLLLLALACGAAAPLETKPDTAPVPAVGTSLQETPTAMPQPIAAGAAPVVNPGRLTWMIGGWGNERFTYNYAVGGGNNFARFMQGYLIATNERTELIPGIATTWEISSDGNTWTFTIRDGGKFHDGSNITADDVWWDFMHYWGKDESGSAIERATQSSAQSQARNTVAISRPAPGQVSITTKSPDAGFPAAMVSETAGNWYGVVPKRPKVHDNDLEAAYDKNPVSSGLMRLTRHTPAELMAFERFEDYYYQPKFGLPEDRRPRFQSLHLRLVPEEATRVAALRAGEADIAPASLATKKQVEAGGGRLIFGLEGAYMYVRLPGCYKPQLPCNNKLVRQALAHAFDKTVIRDQLFGGPEVFQVKGWGVATPSSIGYTPELDPFPYDPARARKLLAEAGYPGGRGMGKMIVNTWSSTAMPFMPESAQLMADSWRRDLGLDVEVKLGDEAALKRDFLTDALHGQILVRDNEARLDGSSSIRSAYGTPDHAGRMHENPEITRMVRDALAVFDPQGRGYLFNQTYRRLREEAYDIAVGYANVPWAVGPRVVTWQPWPLAFYPSNIHGITLK